MVYVLSAAHSAESIPLRGNGTRAISRVLPPFSLSLSLSLSLPVHRERTFADAAFSLSLSSSPSRLRFHPSMRRASSSAPRSGPASALAPRAICQSLLCKFTRPLTRDAKRGCIHPLGPRSPFIDGGPAPRCANALSPLNVSINLPPVHPSVPPLEFTLRRIISAHVARRSPLSLRLS